MLRSLRSLVRSPLNGSIVGRPRVLMRGTPLFIVALGLVPPAISVLKGRQARHPPWMVARDAIRQSGFFAILLGTSLSGTGAQVALSAGVLLLLWGIWHDVRTARGR